MFILLRLAEDVVTFQTLPTQRRRDIQQTLTQNMEKIFSFLLTALQQNVNKYRRMVSGSFRQVHSPLGGVWEPACNSHGLGSKGRSGLKPGAGGVGQGSAVAGLTGLALIVWIWSVNGSSGRVAREHCWNAQLAGTRLG